MIRFATTTDLPALVELLGILFSIEEDFEISDVKQSRGLKMMLADPENRPIWVAEEEEGVVGMCTCQLLVSTAQGGVVGLVEDVVIDPAFREMGIGRDLLSAVEEWAVDNGVSRLQLLCDENNPSALAFYDRIGWESTALVAMRKFV